MNAWSSPCSSSSTFRLAAFILGLILQGLISWENLGHTGGSSVLCLHIRIDCFHLGSCCHSQETSQELKHFQLHLISWEELIDASPSLVMTKQGQCPRPAVDQCICSANRQLLGHPSACCKPWTSKKRESPKASKIPPKTPPLPLPGAGRASFSQNFKPRSF